jgi:methylmalonyl-CoA/ethylmalonyl-CoA epimerase
MIRDIHHVGIAVRNLEAAYAFYRDALMLPVVKENVGVTLGTRAALLAVGRSYLELMEPRDEASPLARFIAEHGEGLHHLALWSDDIDSQVAALHGIGAPVVEPKPLDGFAGRLASLAPESLGGVLVQVVQPARGLDGGPPAAGPLRRIDHVVLFPPQVDDACRCFQEYFGVAAKRTMERGPRRFAFLRPGDVILELVGPSPAGQPGRGRLAGLAFEVNGIDELTDSLRGRGLPVGEPHPAVQGGRIVSVDPSGACGVPVAFIDFSDSPR